MDTIAKSVHLPTSAYTSKSWFEKEQQYLFGKNWQFAGFIEDLPEAGSYLTVQVGSYNILVVKGRDHRLRAFHNLCRHRGTQLLMTCGKAQKGITCPYHDWTYSLNGDLLSVPKEKQEFAGLDKTKLNLHRASVETWLGMIMVHPEADAPALMHWLEGAQDHIGPHRVEELVEYKEASTEHTINANWKIIVENYIDGYHLSHLHSHTLNMYDHQRQQTQFLGPHFIFYEPLIEKYEKNVSSMSPMPLIDHFTDDKPLGGYVPMIFPNLGIGATESSWSIFHVIPLAPDRSLVRIRTRVMNTSDWNFAKQSAKSASHWKQTKPKYTDLPDDHPLLSGDFMQEDILVCERQQQAMRSPMFSVGATAQTQEASVRDFQKIILEKMSEATTHENN